MGGATTPQSPCGDSSPKRGAKNGRFSNRPYAERRGRRSLHGGIVHRLRRLIPNQERRVRLPLPPPKCARLRLRGFTVSGGHARHGSFTRPSKGGQRISAPSERGRGCGADRGVPSDGEDNPSVGSADSSPTGEPRPNSTLAQPGRVPAGRGTAGEVSTALCPPS